MAFVGWRYRALVALVVIVSLVGPVATGEDSQARSNLSARGMEVRWVVSGDGSATEKGDGLVQEGKASLVAKAEGFSADGYFLRGRLLPKARSSLQVDIGSKDAEGKPTVSVRANVKQDGILQLGRRSLSSLRKPPPRAQRRLPRPNRSSPNAGWSSIWSNFHSPMRTTWLGPKRQKRASWGDAFFSPISSFGVSHGLSKNDLLVWS